MLNQLVVKDLNHKTLTLHGKKWDWNGCFGQKTIRITFLINLLILSRRKFLPKRYHFKILVCVSPGTNDNKTMECLVNVMVCKSNHSVMVESGLTKFHVRSQPSITPPPPKNYKLD